MATVTPNFNWPVPTSTDLVKDGATAIEALGDSIDASLVDLKGGTTGQVLSKTSNTDMDFTWVAADDTNAIQNTIVDAKGDLIAASAADTPARLAVGSDGETLVADSSTSTGLRYQPTMAAGKNNVINGALDIWQRGTSIALPANGVGYTADRWYVRNTGSSTVTSRQATNDTTNLPFIQYCLRYSRDSGSTNTAPIYLTQSIETANSIPYAGRTVTYSFYARKGANFSGTIAAQVYSGTGTDQNLINGYTGSVQLLNSAIQSTLTTTWQRYTFTFAVGATATELAVHFDWSPSGTAGAADYLEVTGFQLEIGSVATTFTRAAGTIQGELAACQRYYFRMGGEQTNSDYGIGLGNSGGLVEVPIVLPTKMRVPPTSVDFASCRVYDGTSVIAVSSLILTGTGGGSNNQRVSLTLASGSTSFRPYIFGANGTTASFLGFSAEL